jgi:hypothetical protein
MEMVCVCFPGASKVGQRSGNVDPSVPEVEENSSGYMLGLSALNKTNMPAMYVLIAGI